MYGGNTRADRGRKSLPKSEFDQLGMAGSRYLRDIFAPTGHCPHARIFRLLDPSDERVFSLSALKDKRLFIPVGQPKRANGENLRTFRERELSPLPAVAIARKAS
jgi:hypothetical protein